MRYQALLGASMIGAAALAGSPILASAQTTSDKVEQKMDKATDKVKDTARDAKTGMSDSWLTAKTKIALFADERVKGRQVSVETVKGTVTLRGKVDSAEAKSAAESIASGIDGVQRVKNELQVVAPTERPLVDANDDDLKKAVKDRLARDARLRDVDVRADKGVVTLSGEADSINSAARASEMARAIPGVRSVRNDIDIEAGRVAAGGDMRSSASSDRPGSQQHVKVMQEALKKEGFDPGPADGVHGPRTTAALEAYQKAQNLPVTGEADAETLGKLGVGGATSSMPRQKP